jgi:hypothetical protein
VTQINGVGAGLEVTATDAGAGVATLVNDTAGVAGNVAIVESTAVNGTSAPSLLMPLNLDGYSISGTVPLANLSGIGTQQMDAATVAAIMAVGVLEQGDTGASVYRTEGVMYL